MKTVIVISKLKSQTILHDKGMDFRKDERQTASCFILGQQVRSEGCQENPAHAQLWW